MTPIILQILNGYIAVTALIGAFIFARYIWRERRIGYHDLRPALAIFPVFCGILLIYGPVFINRAIANADGGHYQPPLDFILVGSLIIEAGFLCKIRVFAPEKWKQWSWIGPLGLATLVVAGSLVFVLT